MVLLVHWPASPALTGESLPLNKLGALAAGEIGAPQLRFDDKHNVDDFLQRYLHAHFLLFQIKKYQNEVKYEWH